MRVVALFRVSTERQATEGASLDAQQRIFRDLAVKGGWETIAEFRGHESATQATSDRRVLQQLLHCVREERPDAVYVHEQSRLTRGDELEVATLLRELREGQVKIIVGGVVRDLASIDERFMVGIQSLVDRAEAERFKERWIRGKREKARQGKRTTGRLPFGYTNPPAGTPGRGVLVVVPEEAAVVRRVFAMAASGMGDKRVADALNAQGIPSPGGARWGSYTVRQMLRRVAYIGTTASFVWVKDPRTGRFRYDPTNSHAIVREATHEAIIDRGVWDQIHGRPTLARAAEPWLLTRLAVINGHPVRATYLRRGRPLYAPRSGTRGGPRLERGEADDAVWAAFVSLATTPAFVEGLLAQARDERQQTLLAGDIELLESQVGKHRRRLDRLVTLYADGDITREMFLERRLETERAIAAAEGELGELRGRVLACGGPQAARVVRAVQALLAGRTRLTVQQRRAVLQSIVRKVDIRAERVTGRGRDSLGRPIATQPWRVASVSFTLVLGAGAGEAGVGAAGSVGGFASPLGAGDAPRGDDGPAWGGGARVPKGSPGAVGGRAEHLTTSPLISRCTGRAVRTC